jgi:hypothetical protein
MKPREEREKPLAAMVKETLRKYEAAKSLDCLEWYAMEDENFLRPLLWKMKAELEDELPTTLSRSTCDQVIHHLEIMKEVIGE